MKKKINKDVVEKSILQKKTIIYNSPILHITLKSLLIVTIMGAAIFYSDNRGYFNPDVSSNDTEKKWDAFYEFSDKNNIDVLLLGNSHLYCGINPKNLSTNLSINAFLLASPGTYISDTYYELQEALKKTTPKLIIIETYGISDFNPKELKNGALSDQFKSFSGRKNVITKLVSTPFLFKSDNYFYAWSNTLRNHDFIFKDPRQLSKNKVLINRRPKKNNELFLGRFMRFQSGLENDVLIKYDSLGSPVNGVDYAYNKYTTKYIRKIVKLCDDKDIELMFLTLPMYYKHIDNYLAWDKELGKVLRKYPNKWLNMQNSYDTASFTEICFENTYTANQHLTYDGSLIATYKLADYIKSELSVNLPYRKSETKWKNVFYGQEGYFYYNPVLANDKVNSLLCENFKTNNVLLNEVSVIATEKGEENVIIAKIDDPINDLSNCKLKLAITLVHNNQLKFTTIELQYDIFHKMTDKYIFNALIKPLEIKEVKAALLICE